MHKENKGKTISIQSNQNEKHNSIHILKKNILITIKHSYFLHDSINPRLSLICIYWSQNIKAQSITYIFHIFFLLVSKHFLREFKHDRDI